MNEDDIAVVLILVLLIYIIIIYQYIKPAIYIESRPYNYGSGWRHGRPIDDIFIHLVLASKWKNIH